MRVWIFGKVDKLGRRREPRKKNDFMGTNKSFKNWPGAIMNNDGHFDLSYFRVQDRTVIFI